MKKAIVTGATGFIGSYFVNFLIQKNIEVLAIGRKDYNEISSIRKSKLKGSKYLKINMSNIESLKDEIAKINWDVGTSCVFFNLAWGGEDRLSDLNIEAQMGNVVKSVEALKVAKTLGRPRRATKDGGLPER
ncbi:MAG: NAD-dependent epimerase/dehydratase family protein, partial [Acidobacteriota bacterium]